MTVRAYREDIPRDVLKFIDDNGIVVKRPSFDPYGAAKGAAGGGFLGEIARNFGFEGFTWEKADSSSGKSTTSSSSTSSKTTTELNKKRISKLMEGGEASLEETDTKDVDSSHTDGGADSSTSAKGKLTIPNLMGKIRAEILGGAILGGFWKPMGLNTGTGIGGSGMTMDDVVAQMKEKQAADLKAKEARELKIAENKVAAAEKRELEAKELREAAIEQKKTDAADRKEAQGFTRNIILGVLAFILLVIAAVKSPFA